MVPDEDDLPPDAPEEEEHEVDLPEAVPMQLLRDGRIPVDTATGKEYKPGEVPLGWNEPLPAEELEEPEPEPDP